MDATSYKSVAVAACTITMVVVATLVVRRRRIAPLIIGKVEKARLISIAGGYHEDSHELFMNIFHEVHEFQVDNGALAQKRGHQNPSVFNFFKGNPNNVIAEIHMCRNLETLKASISYDTPRTSFPRKEKLGPFIEALDPHVGIFMKNDNYATMFYNVNTFGAIVVRKTGNRPQQSPQAFNPVIVSFFVQSYQAALKVQGLLLLLGEGAAQPADFPNEKYNEMCQCQARFRDFAEKADVEVHLHRVQEWDDMPPALDHTRMTTPEAWQVLANACHSLEIHPKTEGDPIVSRPFIPAGPTVFGTLRVHHGILLQDM